MSCSGYPDAWRYLGAAADAFRGKTPFKSAIKAAGDVGAGSRGRHENIDWSQLRCADGKKINADNLLMAIKN